MRLPGLSPPTCTSLWVVRPVVTAGWLYTPRRCNITTLMGCGFLKVIAVSYEWCLCGAGPASITPLWCSCYRLWLQIPGSIMLSLFVVYCLRCTQTNTQGKVLKDHVNISLHCLALIRPYNHTGLQLMYDRLAHCMVTSTRRHTGQLASSSPSCPSFLLGWSINECFGKNRWGQLR